MSLKRLFDVTISGKVSLLATLEALVLPGLLSLLMAGQAVDYVGRLRSTNVIAAAFHLAFPTTVARWLLLCTRWRSSAITYGAFSRPVAFLPTIETRMTSSNGTLLATRLDLRLLFQLVAIDTQNDV